MRATSVSPRRRAKLSPDRRDQIVLEHLPAVKLGMDTQQIFAEAAISTSEEMNTARRTFPFSIAKK